MRSSIRIIFPLVLIFSTPSVVFPKESSEEGLFYFRRGQEYFRKMEYAKALREYGRAIQIEPRNELFFKAAVDLCEKFNRKDEKWRHMAVFYRNTGEYDKALFFYERVLAVHRNDIEILNAVGNIYNWRKDYKRAWGYYDRSLGVRENADAFLGRGDVYFFQNVLEKALEEYKRAIALEPAHMLARRRLGQVYEKRGEYSEALREYKIVLKNKANDADVWIKAGSIYEIERDFQNARASYAKAAEYDPGNPDALNGLGRAAVALGQYDEAETVFKDAMHAASGMSKIDSLNGLGWLYAWKGDERKAQGYFYRAMGPDGFNREAATGLAWIHSRAGEYDKAMEWYGRAQDQKNGSADVASAIGMAWIHARRGEFDKGVELYKGVLKERPNDVEVYNGLGWLYAQSGDLNSARRFYDKSVGLRARNPDAHYGIAQILEKELLFEEAIKHYQLALGYNPLNIPYKKALAICYLKNQNDEKSRELLSELVERDDRDEEVWSTFAFLNARSGRLEEAAEAYRHILQDINPDSLDAASGLAEVYAAMNDDDRAAQMYEGILQKDPNNRIARRGLANAHKRKGLYDKALEGFKWLISTKHNDVESWNGLGWIYLRLRDYSKAIESYQKGLSFFESNPDGLVGLSHVYLEMIRNTPSKEEKEGYFQLAARNCLQVLELYPAYRDAYICLAELYEEMGDAQGATRVLEAGLGRFKESLKKRPSDKTALQETLGIQKAVFVLRNKKKIPDGLQEQDLDGLVREYERLLDLKINDTQVWLELASLYRMVRQYDKAQEVLEKAIGCIEEDHAGEVKLGLAEVLLLKGDPGKAERLYGALLKSGADDARIYFGLGRVHELKKNLGRAAQFYQNALRRRGKDNGADYKEARLHLARVLAKRGFFSEAVKTYEAGLSRKPMDEEYNLKAHKETGEIYLKMGYLTKAERSYQKCLSLKPVDFDSLMALAHVARFRGDFEEAVRRYQELLVRDPNNAYIHRILGNVYFWTRDWEEARQEYQLALNPSSPSSAQERREIEKDVVKLKRAGASSFVPRFKYSESKEDDTGRGNHITETRAWDSGFRYRHVVNSRLSLNGGFSYSSTKEKNIPSSLTNFDIDSDFKTAGFEYHPMEDVEIAGSFNSTGYRRNGELEEHRTPLKKSRDFQGYDVGIKYSHDRSFLSLNASKEPLRVKIFTDDPELDFYSKYNFSIGLGGYPGDVMEVKGTYGVNYYSPSDLLRQLYRASVAWNLYNQNLELFSKKEGLPFISFQRSDGLRVLSLESFGFFYVNSWVKNVTAKLGFEKKRHSDENRADAAKAGAVFKVPFLEGLNFGYDFSFEDYRFTAGSIGGEPTYRSPQDMAIHFFSATYSADISDKLKGSLGYAFSFSSEDESGHSAFFKASFDMGEETTLNLEVEANDDASFAKEEKYLVHLTRRFF